MGDLDFLAFLHKCTMDLTPDEKMTIHFESTDEEEQFIAEQLTAEHLGLADPISYPKL